MTDVELVIKIPEEIYQHYKKVWQKRRGSIPESCIAFGIPLPKGHGDLIDRGKLKTHFIGTEQGTDLEVYLEPTIIGAKAILKADGEQEDGNDSELRWIPTSEGLPKKTGWYLITFKIYKSNYAVSEMCYRKPENYWTRDDISKKILDNDEVIAWMPLPKPYKAENEE